MSARPSSAAVPSSSLGPLEGAYQPGACNIGPAEIARRRQGAWAGTIVTVVLYALLVALGVPAGWRFLVAVPAAGAAISWLQVRLRFCVAFGFAGRFNFGAVGRTQQVGDAAAHRADVRRVALMVGSGVVAGLLVGLLAVWVP